MKSVLTDGKNTNLTSFWSVQYVLFSTWIFVFVFIIWLQPTGFPPGGGNNHKPSTWKKKLYLRSASHTFGWLAIIISHYKSHLYHTENHPKWSSLRVIILSICKTYIFFQTYIIIEMSKTDIVEWQNRECLRMMMEVHEYQTIRLCLTVNTQAPNPIARATRTMASGIRLPGAVGIISLNKDLARVSMETPTS